MKRIVWTDPARIDVRSLSKPTAMQILSALHRFAESGAGNVKALQEEKSFDCGLGTTGFSSSAPIPTPSRFAASVIAAKPTAELPITPPPTHSQRTRMNGAPGPVRQELLFLLRRVWERERVLVSPHDRTFSANKCR